MHVSSCRVLHHNRIIMVKNENLKEDYYCGIYDSMSARGVILAAFSCRRLLLLRSQQVFLQGLKILAIKVAYATESPKEQTSISISGLPEKFEANTTYNLTLTVVNELILENVGEPYGGFR